MNLLQLSPRIITTKSHTSNRRILLSISHNNNISLKPPSQTHHHLTLTFTRLTKTQISIFSTTKPTKSNSNLNPLFTQLPAHNHNNNIKTTNNNFWSAVTLIIGTAVGPGMLALPSKTLKSGPLPSTLTILLSYLYVISSILLIAELTYTTMKQHDLDEVSFTTIAIKSFGKRFATFISLIYASLSFSLMVACVSGIGSVISQSFPKLHFLLANAMFPIIVGTLLCFFPFRVIDVANRALCVMMIVFITTLVGVGLSIARGNIVDSFRIAKWTLPSVLPAVPVTVLTLGFHVVTPFVCRIVGGNVKDACKAVLVGGSVPLLMVLSWNLIVLGLVGTGDLGLNPISLLLSVKSSAAFAVQGFAFSALATSFIGYVVSFPKQLMDTLELIFGCNNSGKITVDRLSIIGGVRRFVFPVVLVVPVLVASFYPSTFSRALDFAGVYANCFLFGILPPLMTYRYKAKKMIRTSILPGGDVSLFLLFSVAVVLGIWH